MSFLFVGLVSKPEIPLATALHSHPFYEIVLTLKGTGTVDVGGREFRMHEGSVLIIPPNVLHEGHPDGAYEEIYIQADSFPAHIEELQSGIVYEKNDQDLSLTTLARSLLYRFVRGKKDGTFSLLYELFLRLLAERSASLKTDPVVEEVCSLLARNYHDPELSLAEVLSATGYQKDHVRRRFVAVCGVTPVAYLTGLRMEHAKQLLERRQEMGLTVAEIALRCGYYDSHYFSKVFRKHVGVTPEHFMKKK